MRRITFQGSPLTAASGITSPHFSPGGGVAMYCIEHNQNAGNPEKTVVSLELPIRVRNAG